VKGCTNCVKARQASATTIVSQFLFLLCSRVRVSINYKIIFASSLQMLLFLSLGDSHPGLLGIDRSSKANLNYMHILSLFSSLLAFSLSLRLQKFVTFRNPNLLYFSLRSSNHLSVGAMTPQRAQRSQRNI